MKIWNYVFISTFIALFMGIAGVPVGQEVLTAIGINLAAGTSALGTSLLYLAVDGIIGLFAGVGVIVIGLLVGQKSENFIVAGIVSAALIVFLGTFYGILQQAMTYSSDPWIGWIVWIVFVPLTVGFIFGIAEFLRGTD